MAVFGNSDFSRFIYVEKSREKTQCCYGAYYDCIRVLGLGGRRWEVFLLNHVRWGCFVVLVSKCVVFLFFCRIPVHHLSIFGARTVSYSTSQYMNMHTFNNNNNNNNNNIQLFIPHTIHSFSQLVSQLVLFPNNFFDRQSRQSYFR